MGRPAHARASRPAGSNRREFFKRSGGAAALAVAGASAPLLAPAATQGPRFQHGVASGDPLADRVILWTRVTPPEAGARSIVQYEVAGDADFRQVVVRGVLRTDAARDHTVKVDAGPLRPGTTYYYRFRCGAEASPVGRTRTLPQGFVRRARVAVLSCSNFAAGLFNAYARVAARADLDLVIHLGDYLYEYGADEFGSLRQPQPVHEILTLTDYRTRHAQYKTDLDLQALHRQHPMVCIWDDHEVANDAWQGGAQNHTEGVEGTWDARVGVAMQAYREWMPVREQAAPRGQARAYAFGDLFDLLMLEERLVARSKQLVGTIDTPFGPGFEQTGDFLDPSRSLLGDAQEGWLADRLRTSRARWKLVGQGVMFAQLKARGATLAEGGGVFLNPDQWDGYQPARDRVYAVLEGSGDQPRIDNVVILTGDIHSSWAADLNRDPNNPDPDQGGYDPRSGRGSQAVEFVTTSVTSPGLSDPSGNIAKLVRVVNPHVRFVDFERHGYTLLDITAGRVVCEWWFVDTVESPSAIETLGAAFEVASGDNHLAPSAGAPSRVGAPRLAP